MSLRLRLSTNANLPCCPLYISGSPIHIIKWWDEKHCHFFSVYVLNFLLQGNDLGDSDDLIQCTVKFWRGVAMSVSAGTCDCVPQYCGTCCVEWACSPSSISKLCNRSRTIIVYFLRWEKYSNSKSDRYHRKARCVRPPRFYIASCLQAEILGPAMFWSLTKQLVYMVWGIDVPEWRETCFNSPSQSKVWNSVSRVT